MSVGYLSWGSVDFGDTLRLGEKMRKSLSEPGKMNGASAQRYTWMNLTNGPTRGPPETPRAVTFSARGYANPEDGIPEIATSHGGITQPNAIT